MCEECGCSAPHEPEGKKESPSRLIELQRDVRAANNLWAKRNREHLVGAGAVALNLISSPGAGKTTLLERTLRKLSGDRPAVVIEGDQQTDNDARRIAATGVKAVQINTGAACHLDARQIHQALHHLELPEDAILFIENVGNLICPAGFDLGQSAEVVLLSVAEGEDKPEKYPEAFRAADAMVLTKIDLLPHLEFDRQQCLHHARALNPELPVFELSAKTGEGLEDWVRWLENLA